MTVNIKITFYDFLPFTIILWVFVCKCTNGLQKELQLALFEKAVKVELFGNITY